MQLCIFESSSSLGKLCDVPLCSDRVQDCEIGARVWNLDLCLFYLVTVFVRVFGLTCGRFGVLRDFSGCNLSSIKSNLNHDLSNLNKWLTSNKLTLNATKTEFMLIGFRQRLSTLPDTIARCVDRRKPILINCLKRLHLGLVP